MNTIRIVNTRAVLIAILGLAVFGAEPALAVGTASGTPVLNRATVDYQVGGIDQTSIESAPGGNSTPGAGNGTDTTFVVDNRVDLTVVEIGGAATSVNPGQSDAITSFRVSNTGNAAQDFALGVGNLSGGTLFGNTDNIDAGNLRIFVDSNANGVYEPALDTATFIDELAADDDVVVFVLGDFATNVANGDAANIRLTATTHNAGAAGLGTITVESAGPDDPNVVDIVFGDAGEDGLEADDDGYLVVSAQLSVSKSSVVISDPFNNTTNPLAIPGAVMEYTVTITNTGATAATSVRISDTIDANLTFLAGQYNGGAADVEITVGTQPTTYCTADAGDGDTDGCGLTGATLDVDPGISVGTTAADNPAVVRFRVTID